ncbi:MAG TPA: transglutaminase-like domain-containing protein [Melioribacteraceae bacterium]|nr:transglutaminase-like domain-containing protein [Melioribacteraceae bacterium]
MNTEHNKLISLLHLLDDDNEDVKKEVRTAFENYGLMLEKDITDLNYSLNDDRIKPILDIIWNNRRIWLKLQWSKTITIEDEYLLLERGLELLIKYDYGIKYNPNLSDRIKELSFKYMKDNDDLNVLDLANFLFIAEGYEGCKEDYYNPQNSNLDYVLTYKKGLPISLTILFMLTAKNLGFRVEGCRFPGHFLAKAFIKDNYILIDCFNRGKIISDKELRLMAEESYESFLTIVKQKTTVKMILIRILSNLYKAYEIKGDITNRDFFEELALMIKSNLILED